MEISDLRHLPVFNASNLDEQLDHPTYRERAEVCFEKRNILGFKVTRKTQLYVRGVLQRVLNTSSLGFNPGSNITYNFLEAFRDINYENGHSKPKRRTVIPLESITQYRSLVER
ncbi:hypothetical protein HYW75_04765 [Candidatus Pacearchaeota archaeon]|nr:hypothetical protein [Candidatus Pacearchaeota archaeon]